MEQIKGMIVAPFTGFDSEGNLDLGKYGNGAGKAFMKAAGLDLGPVRRPFRNLTDEEYARFEKEIKEAGFDKYKCFFKYD